MDTIDSRKKCKDISVKFVVTLLIVTLLLQMATTSKVSASRVDLLQMFFIESMSIQGEQRNLFLEQVLDNLHNIHHVTDDIIDLAATFIPNMESEDLKTCLEIYAGRSQESKENMYNFIKFGMVIVPEEERDAFAEIALKFNEVFTGDPLDARGMDFFYTILYYARVMTYGVARIADNGSNGIYMHFSLAGYSDVKSDISRALNYMPTLKQIIQNYDGETDFDKLLLYAEGIVNSCDMYEVYEFKKWLVSKSLFKAGRTPFDPENYEGPTTPFFEIGQATIEKDTSIVANVTITPVVTGRGVIIFKLTEKGNIPTAIIAIEDDIVAAETYSGIFPGYSGDRYSVKVFVWDRLANSPSYMGIDYAEPVLIE